MKSLLLCVLAVVSLYSQEYETPDDVENSNEDLPLLVYMDSVLRIDPAVVMVQFSREYPMILKQMIDTTKLPCIDFPIGDLATVERRFAESFDRYYRKPSVKLSDFERALEDAFVLNDYLRDRIRVDHGYINGREGLYVAFENYMIDAVSKPYLQYRLPNGTTISTIEPLRHWKYISVNLMVGFVNDGGNMRMYLNRPNSFINSTSIICGDSTNTKVAVDGEILSIVPEDSLHPVFSFNVSTGIDLGDGWVSAGTIIPNTRKYIEGIQNFGEMRLSDSSGDRGVIRFGLADKNGVVQYSQKNQKLYTSLDSLTVKLKVNSTDSPVLNKGDLIVDLSEFRAKR